MSDIRECRFCDYSDGKRRLGGLIRCTRFSRWAKPHDQPKCYADPSIAWLQKRWPRRDKEDAE